MQSFDEPAHLSRAYLLSKGAIFLNTKEGETGGDIDTGLLSYIDSFQSFPFQYDRKITATDIRASKQINWSGQSKFLGFFNTAIYFPLPYFPQAMAFAFGERSGLTVKTTYYLARLFSLAATLCLLWSAMLLYPTPPLVLALFVTPMTLFQLGSASLDSVTFGTCALTASLFLRGSDARFSFNVGLHVALVICVLSLAMSRISLIPLTLLPAVLYTVRHSLSYLITAAFSACLSLAWIMFSLLTVKGMPPRELSTLDTAKHYLVHPGGLFRIFFKTLWNYEILRSYWTMFIGVLGWLDTPLDFYVYIVFGALLFALAALSIQRNAASWVDRGNLSLLCASALSLAFTFVIELLAWTPVNSEVIGGIQGRYFTPILILSGYTMFGRRLSSIQLRWSLLAIFTEITLSIVSMAPKLLNRYWIS
jgi:uncharacterized membrane protein